MRIGFVGNTNNVPFLLAESARSLGIHAELFLLSGGTLHDPRAKLADSGDLPSWIHDHTGLAEMDYGSVSPAAMELVRSVRASCDFVFLNGQSPSLARHIDLPFVFNSTGSDVTFYASHSSLDTLTASWDEAFRADPAGRAALEALASAVERQRGAILDAERFATGHPRGLSPELDEILAAVGFDESRRVLRRLVDPLRTAARPPAPPRDELRVFSPARVDFLPRQGFSSLDYKGTDRLIEGLARFVRGGGRASLCLTRKGHDCDAADRLAERLGVSERISWVPERPYVDYLEMLEWADIVCDALSPAGPAGVCHDALGLGRPVLGDLRPDVFGPIYGGDGYPGLHASDAEAVEEGLARASANPGLLADLRDRGLEFASRELAPERFVVDLIEGELGGSTTPERPISEIRRTS